MKQIDLRSDTVTKPTPEMRQVIAQAKVGDDVFADDPTVNELQDLAADITGMEAAIFAASGTQTNLLALMSICQRGDEYIVGQQAHTYRNEGGGAAVLGSIQPQPLDFEPDGTLDLDKVASAIKPDDDHFAKTRLLCLENTHSGKVLPASYLPKAVKFAKQHNLQIHLDGARIFNAAVKLGVEAKTLIKGFDSVSICLSKGLGAPVGSVLCGSKALIKQARRWRKMLGGGMRQAGLMAAAGQYVLENNIARLADDHANAQRLAEGLAEIEELNLDVTAVDTNMVFISLAPQRAQALSSFLQQHNIITINRGGHIRLVTHLDINQQDVVFVIECFKEFFSGLSS